MLLKVKMSKYFLTYSYISFDCYFSSVEVSEVLAPNIAASSPFDP